MSHCKLKFSFFILVIVIAASAQMSVQADDDDSLLMGLKHRVVVLEELLAVLQSDNNALEGRVSDLEADNTTIHQRISELEQGMYLKVDCAAGETVADALAQSSKTTQRVTIVIDGLCQEKVWLYDRRNIWLVGATPGSGIRSLSAWSSQGVVIQNLSIANCDAVGEQFGVTIKMGSAVYFDNVDISDHSDHGLFVTSSSVHLNGSRIERNDGSGILAWVGSSVNIWDTLFADNDGGGVDLRNGSSGLLEQGTRLTGNGGGIWLLHGSSIDVRNTTIDSNLGPGLWIYVNSAAALQDVVIEDNTGDGVTIHDSGVLIGGKPDPNVLIQNNNGWAVWCADPPSVPQLSGGKSWFSSSGNTLGVTNCPLPPWET